MIKRDGIYFITQQEKIIIWNGRPNCVGSEYICVIPKSILPQILNGLFYISGKQHD